MRALHPRVDDGHDRSAAVKAGLPRLVGLDQGDGLRQQGIAQAILEDARDVMRRRCQLGQRSRADLHREERHRAVAMEEPVRPPREPGKDLRLRVGDVRPLVRDSQGAAQPALGDVRAVGQAEPHEDADPPLALGAFPQLRRGMGT